MFVPYFKYCMKLLPFPLNRGYSRSRKGSERARSTDGMNCPHTRNAQIDWDSSVCKKT